MMDTVGNKAARAEIAHDQGRRAAMALRVIDRAIQAHGGAGVCDDFPWPRPGPTRAPCAWPTAPTKSTGRRSRKRSCSGCQAVNREHVDGTACTIKKKKNRACTIHCLTPTRGPRRPDLARSPHRRHDGRVDPRDDASVTWLVTLGRSPWCGSRGIDTTSLCTPRLCDRPHFTSAVAGSSRSALPRRRRVRPGERRPFRPYPEIRARRLFRITLGRRGAASGSAPRGGRPGALAGPARARRPFGGARCHVRGRGRARRTASHRRPRRVQQLLDVLASGQPSADSSYRTRTQLPGRARLSSSATRTGSGISPAMRRCCAAPWPSTASTCPSWGSRRKGSSVRDRPNMHLWVTFALSDLVFRDAKGNPIPARSAPPFSTTLVGRLKPSATIQQAQAQGAGLAPGLASLRDRGLKELFVRVEPLRIVDPVTYARGRSDWSACR